MTYCSNPLTRPLNYGLGGRTDFLGLWSQAKGQESARRKTFVGSRRLISSEPQLRSPNIIPVLASAAESKGRGGLLLPKQPSPKRAVSSRRAGISSKSIGIFMLAKNPFTDDSPSNSVRNAVKFGTHNRRRDSDSDTLWDAAPDIRVNSVRSPR